MTDTDEEGVWVAQSRQGDSDAFGNLVRSYQRMIHALTYRMTGSPTASEDLAQETFIRAYARLRLFRGDAKFSSWLYRIAINLCLDWRNCEKRRDRAQRTWAQAAESAGVSQPEALSEQVQSALMQLTAKQRAVIVLTVYEDMSHAQAAAVLGCPEATVSWRVFAARRRLAKMLSSKGRR